MDPGPETSGADGCHPREIHIFSDFDMQTRSALFVFIFQLTPTHSRSRRQLVEETIHLAPVLTAILHHSLDVNNHCLSQFIEQIICVIVVKATLHQQHLPKAQTRPRPSIAPSGVSLSHRILKPNSYVQPKYLCPSSSSDSHSLRKKIKRHYATHLREYQTKRVSPERQLYD